MTCEIEKRDGRLHIRGEMTIYGAAGLRDELFAALQAEPNGCALELGGVSEFDTTGLQLLLMARKECSARGGSFSVANPSPAVRDTLDLVRVANLCPAEAEV